MIPSDDTIQQTYTQDTGTQGHRGEALTKGQGQGRLPADEKSEFLSYLVMEGRDGPSREQAACAELGSEQTSSPHGSLASGSTNHPGSPPFRGSKDPSHRPHFQLRASEKPS